MLEIEKKIMAAMKAANEAKKANDLDGEKAHKIESETYKLIKAKILEYKTAKNAKPYDEAAEIALLQKMVKERKDTAEVYKTNNRPELAENELAEANVIEALLPAIPTAEDVEKYIAEHYPNGIDKKQMGAVIKEVKTELIGVDGKTVSDVVKTKLL